MGQNTVEVEGKLMF